MACERGGLPSSSEVPHAAIPVCTDHICQQVNLFGYSSQPPNTEKHFWSASTPMRTPHSHTPPPWPAQIKLVASGFQEDEEGGKAASTRHNFAIFLGSRAQRKSSSEASMSAQQVLPGGSLRNKHTLPWHYHR